MMSAAIKLIVFDWDGTLMDSEAQIVHCLHGAIKDLGLAPMTDETVSNVIGLGLREAIDMLVPGQDTAFQQAFVEAYRNHWLAHEHSSLFEGTREVLELLRAEGFLLGLATGKSRRGLIRVLEQTALSGYFSVTRCADESLSKPHPRMLLELMTEAGVSSAQTLMVGDTEYDLEMARNAGVGRVAVRSGVHSEQRLLRYAPLACLDGVADMPDWMRRVGLLRQRLEQHNG